MSKTRRKQYTSEWLSPTDAAERLSVSVRKLQYLAKQGEIQRRKEGRRSFYRVPVAGPGAVRVSDTPTDGVAPVRVPAPRKAALSKVVVAKNDGGEEARDPNRVREINGAPVVTMNLEPTPDAEARVAPPVESEGPAIETTSDVPAVQGAPDWVRHVGALERRIEALEAEMRSIRDGVTHGVERVEDHMHRLTQQVAAVRVPDAPRRSVESTPSSSSPAAARTPQGFAASPYHAALEANARANAEPAAPSDADLLHAALLQQLATQPEPAESSRVPARRARRTRSQSAVNGVFAFVQQFVDWALGRTARR